MWSEQCIQLIQAACDEDLDAQGDITTRMLGGPDEEIIARVVPRAAGVICGLALGPQICDVFAERTRQKLKFEAASHGGEICEDGRPVRAGEVVATVQGPRAAVLAVERTLLNFLGRMSGVATLTRKHVDAAKAANPGVQVLDTRKTIPGWRELDKYAVRMGGGMNHRLGLYDAVLIKDNHLADVPAERLAGHLFRLLSRISTRPAGALRQPEPAAPATGQSEPAAPATGQPEPAAPATGQPEPAAPATGQPEPAAPATGHPPAPPRRADSTPLPVRAAGGQKPRYMIEPPDFVEVEVDSLAQLAEVFKVVGVDVVLLDNFSLADMSAAVRLRDSRGLGGRVALEASGRVTLESIADIAATGVDRISVGALTHSAPSLDIGLDL